MLVMALLTPKILYIGSNSPASTSRHRADALKRLGCEIFQVNPWKLIGSRSRLQAWMDYRTGFRFHQRKLHHCLKAALFTNSFIPDLIWVDGGELIGYRVLKSLKAKYDVPTILFNVDDPTGRRDGSRFLTLLSSIQLFHLCVSCRSETSLEFLAIGARRSLVVSRSYDEIIHHPEIAISEDYERSVSFVGTNIPFEGRDKFLARLALAGLPLTIHGDRWHKSRRFSQFQAYWRGPSLSGDAYRQAISSPAISLGLLSHGNRDLVTQRSFETPACGGLFCAERTSEHQLLFEDGVEAVLWDSAEECISICKNLLADTPRNYAIRSEGQNRILSGGFGNEDICRQVLNAI